MSIETRLNMVNDSVLDLIGNTPMVDVSVLSPKPSVRLVAKLENQNPFGSVKDRIAKAMIEAAEKDGRLQPGQRILEPSSGNTGIALAAIAQIKGYPITILMPTSVSVERRQMLQIFGADIVLTPGEEGSNGAVRRAQEMAEKHPSGASSISTATTPTRAPTTKLRVPKFCVIAPRSRTSSRVSAPREP